MTLRRPLVLDNGRIAELPQGQSVAGAPTAATGAVVYLEPVVVPGWNTDVVHGTGVTPVPMFVTTPDGDIVTAGVY